ncbi:MAG: HD domain-containing protein [bacterium]|nr:HD domain-containing protein [bacterium]
MDVESLLTFKDINWLHVGLAFGLGNILNFWPYIFPKRQIEDTAPAAGEPVQKTTESLSSVSENWQAVTKLLDIFAQSDNFKAQYNGVAEAAATQLQALYSALFMRVDNRWIIRGAYALSDKTVNEFKLGEKDGFVSYLIERNKPFILEEGNRQLSSFKGMGEPIIEALLIPMRIGKAFLGFVLVANKTQYRHFDAADLDMANFLSVLFSAAVNGPAASKNAQTGTTRLLTELCKAMESHIPACAGHSERVAEYAQAVARKLEFDEGEVEVLKTAALLHDLGELMLAPELRNEDPNSDDAVRFQTKKTADLLRPLGYFVRAIPSIRSCHELYDGTGYPDNLKSAAIPPGAVIIGICEKFDKLLNGTAGQPAVGLEKALLYFRERSGKLYDARTCDAALQVFTEKNK